MTFAEELKLMDNLLKLGFGREYIIWTLLNCENGISIGQAMCNAITQTTRNDEFPRSSNE